MNVVQVSGIAVACLIMVALVVSLVITRRKDKAIAEREAAEAVEGGGSFFDEAPHDQFDMLGRREAVAEEHPGGVDAEGPAAAVAGPSPLAGDAAGAAMPAQAAPPIVAAAAAGQSPAETAAPLMRQPAATDLHVRVEETRHAVKEALEHPFAAEPDGTPIAQEPAAEGVGAERAAALPRAGAAATPEQEAESTAPLLRRPEAAVGEQPAVEGATSKSPPEETADRPPAAAVAPPPQPVAAAATVPLSEVLITTNEHLIDMSDPDVRRMLKDLVKNEIDLAAQFRALDEFEDAVAQLTEAERICTALGLTSQAALVRAMIAGLRR